MYRYKTSAVQSAQDNDDLICLLNSGNPFANFSEIPQAIHYRSLDNITTVSVLGLPHTQHHLLIHIQCHVMLARVYKSLTTVSEGDYHSSSSHPPWSLQVLKLFISCTIKGTTLELSSIQLQFAFGS